MATSASPTGTSREYRRKSRRRTPAKCSPRACAIHSAMKATTAPAAAGAMLYHSMLIQVPTCPTSFHQLYSMMKSAAVAMAQRPTATSTARITKFRIFEGCIS